MRGWLVFILITAVHTGKSQAVVIPVPYSVPGATYVQNFDGLPITGSFSLTGKGPFNLSAAPVSSAAMGGWQILMLSGSNANAGFGVATGSSTGNAVYSLGANASTERALGSLSSSTGIYTMGMVLTNQTGAPLNYFNLRFTTEQWRKGGSGNKNVWSFRYKTGNIVHIDQPGLSDEPNLNFSSISATTGVATLVGNLPENQQIISYTVYGINWKAGEQLLVRWDDADETGNDDIMALDNLSFSAGLSSSAPTITAAIASAVTTNTATFSGTVADNFATTTVVFEYDTAALFTNLQTARALPDTIQAGSGNTNVTAQLSALTPGKTYYYRLKAQNNLGGVSSAVKNFTTAFIPPVVTTTAASSVFTSSAVVGGNVLSIANEAISERGIVWALTNNPSTANNKIPAGVGSGNFSQLITGLPQGNTVYARAYGINAGGTAYGDTIRLITQTLITALLPSGIIKTNASSVNFILKTAQAITGLSARNFSVIASGITGASVTAVTGNANNFTITVNTGNGNGSLSLALADDTGLSLPVNNKTYTGTGYYMIDKLPPQVKKVSIPDVAMKIGDTIPVSISFFPDTDLFKMNSGNINGFLLSSLVKKNDSTYTSSFIISAGGNDVEALIDIPVSISLSDSIGNTNLFQSPINQSNDLLDANKPFILSVQNPPKGIYKTGDTLNFVFRFSEKIIVSGAGIPSITITIGSRSRTALYVAGNNTDSLVLRYIIVADDLDNDGIKTTSSITLNNALVKDIAGNSALLNFTSGLQANDILVDAVSPVINSVQLPANKTYGIGDTLPFIFIFSKPVILRLQNDTPLVKITIGTVDKNIVYAKMVGGNALLFNYTIQYGDLDKNGISLATSITLNNSRLTDSIGNTATLGFKTNSLANIKIDALAPIFTITEKETVFVCENSTVTITNAFAVNDEEAGELVSWKIKNTPQLGTISLPAFSATSTGKNIIPAGIIYKPFANQNGTDTLVTELTDGINTTQKSIIVIIQQAIQNNRIQSSQIICEEKLPAMLAGNAPSGGSGQYKYLWESSSDSLHFLVTAGKNDQLNYQPDILHTNTWFRRRVVSGACSDTSSNIKITTLKNGLWTGNKNYDWHNATNWCGGLIPNSATNVFIYTDALYQPLIKDSAFCNDLIMGAGARLTVTGILAMMGNIYADKASLQLEKGTILYNGLIPQNIDGNHFEKNSLENIIINNTSGVFVSGNIRLTGRLLLIKGWLQTNDQLLLKPGAMIGPSATGTAVNGNVQMEHLIKGGKRLFHLLGNPFSQPIALQMLGDSLDITGENGSTNGFVTTKNNNPSAFFYNYHTGNDSTGVDAGWVPFTNTNGLSENAWKKYAGIRLLFNGKPGQGLDGILPGDGSNGTYFPQPVILKITGHPNTGDQEILLQRDAYPAYHVIGNPYASAIDLSRITRSAGVGNYYWLWDPLQGKNGGYTSIPFSSGSTLPVMGALIVKAVDSVNSSLLFSEHCKTKTSVDTIPVFQSDDAFFVEIRLETDTIFWDRLLLLQMDSARAGVDKNDAEKFINPEVNFYSLSRENKKLSVDARPITDETLIPLGLLVSENGSFSLRIAKAKFPSSNTLLLHDRYLDRWLPLETDSVYQFTTTTDTFSRGEKRFEIRSRKKPADSLLTKKNLVMTTYPVPAKNTIVVKYASAETGNTAIRIIDLLGNLVKSIPLGMQKQGQVIIPVANLVSGIYVIEIRCGNDVSMQKIIKE